MVQLIERSISLCEIESLDEVAAGIFTLRFRAPELAAGTLPGQFINIRVGSGYEPLLRRPFSVYHTQNGSVEIIFNIVGLGTRILAAKRAGEILDVLGPLGQPYKIADEYETGVLVAGGLGVAPLPMITRALLEMDRPIITFLGARTSGQIVDRFLQNVYVSTDDGSAGYRGTVVDHLIEWLRTDKIRRPKIFGCGPTAMLRRLAAVAEEFSVPCEVSLECAMACGFGVCQGCPVERRPEGLRRGVGRGAQPEGLYDLVEDGRTAQRKYSLVCKDGPVFNTKEIVIT